MDNKKLIEALRFCGSGAPCCDCPVYDECIKYRLSLTQTAADALERQMWISVEDRLPEAHEDGTVDAVLVTDGEFTHMAYYARNKWRFCESGEMKEEMFYKVTHWMPLPESPKEEEV